MFLLDIFADPIVQGIIGSLIAGFLTIGIIESYKYWKLYLFHRKFKKVFGTHNKDRLHLVVPALLVRPDVIQLLQASPLPGNQFPLLKFGGAFIRSSKLLAYADTVSLKYILDIVATTLGSRSVIMTDEDLQKLLDLSLISFGGSSFYCSYVLNQLNNRFYNFNGNAIVSTKNANISFQIDDTYDYGFIIKYRHDNFPKRTWIIIAGLGESGTRGASWFLSRHWRQLSDAFCDSPFGLVIKVNHGVDDSAIEVHRTT